MCSFAVAALSACQQPVVHPDRSAISAAYRDWVSTQTAAGRFLPRERCRYDSISSQFEGDNTPLIDELWCIEKPDHVDSSFCDMNADGVEDGFYGVFPSQCDLGNASMWSQLKIVVLSSPTGYVVNDTLFDGTGDEFPAWLLIAEEGFVLIDSITDRHFVGNRVAFRDGDGHCCPSIREPFSITLSDLQQGALHRL
jgi:hypothetical protein